MAGSARSAGSRVRAGGAELIDLLYHVFVGLPLCLVLVTMGLLFCLTILGLPVGLTLIAAGFKAL